MNGSLYMPKCLSVCHTGSVICSSNRTGEICQLTAWGLDIALKRRAVPSTKGLDRRVLYPCLSGRCRGTNTKTVTAAAHSMVMSNSDALGVHTACICRRISGVMGRRGREGGMPCCARSRHPPVCINRRRGRDDPCRGSGSPRMICVCRTAAKYVLIVVGANPCLASVATK